MLLSKLNRTLLRHYHTDSFPSWSPSGELLASGSDDTFVRLYEYLPQSSTDQFKLKANIATGHRANIFSVKFMPHTNERTIITASADGEARVIDIEGGVSKGRFHRLQTHEGPVKRIVTEDSPFYFLTCSEDGTVRQWDTRVDPGEVELDWPQPLISYAHYNIELRTMSCSPRQPHYIALGGDHLHCFLHDRRMSGRDKVRERGGLFWLGKSTKTTILEEATQCVRKFAPGGKQRMTKFDSGGLITYGHGITACKISNADPNELIVSWSDDKIYSFDMLRDEQPSKSSVNETEANEQESSSEVDTSVSVSENNDSPEEGMSQP
jgi:nuclear receptor interaction protein